MKRNTQLTGKKIGSGLVFGKFLPLHAGHVHLIDFAKRSCNKLTILVCSLKSEPIPGEIRYEWVKTMFPDANVIHHYEEIPQEPSEHPNFWNIWKESIGRHCPGEEFDALFGSEDYGWKMADVMGIEYVPVDRLRDQVPVSGTKMRENPMKYWDYLPWVVKPYFAKRVCVVGPESSGKTTMTKMLAEKYDSAYVLEYARMLLDEYVANRGYGPGEVRYEDIATIARGQMVTEDSMATRANRVLLCDTDLLTTQYWSNFYFGKCPEWVKKEALNRKYSLYLLLDVDVPWVKDDQRPMPELEKRKEYLKWWEDELTKRGCKYVKISGNWDERFARACEAVDEIVRV